MKTRYQYLCLGWILFGAWLPLSAQPVESEEKELPTEISEPPYEVGNLVTIQGYYIEREDAPSINFRIVDNKIRIYWIDEDGLIAEPEAVAATVRFSSTVHGRPYHRAVPLPEKGGLGAPGVVPPPHTFNVILTPIGPDSEPMETYAFRYVPAMNESKDPEIPVEAEADPVEAATE